MMNKKLLALSIGIAFTSLYGCNATKTDKTESTAVEASQSNDSDKSKSVSLPDTALIAKVPTLSYDKRYDQSNTSILENHFRYGIAPITEIKSNLDEMYNKLLSASGSSIKLPSSITILNSQSYADNSGVDGNIFISRVILADAQNDDEIAFAVAHEMAHLILQHHQSDKVKDVIHTITGAIEQMEALNQKSKKAKKSDTKAKIKLTNMIYDKVINSAWGRSQENEADLLAIDIMSKAGYNVANVNHISKFFDRLETYESAMEKKNTIQNIMSSLQSAFSSQDEDQSKPEQKKSSGPLGVLGASLGGGGMVGGLLSGKTDPDALKQTAVLALISGALEGLKEDHPTPADRRNNVTAYVDKFYATTTEFKPAKKDFHKVIQANQEAFTAYANIAKLSADTLEQNTSLLSSLPKKYVTLPVVEFYSAVTKAKGNPDVKSLEKVITNTKVILPPAEAYQTLAKAYRESGDTNKSQTVLTKLKNDYGNGEFLKPYLTLE